MADKKVEKALYGPSTVEVALGAVLGLLLGGVFAAVYLVFKPVTAVKERPKEPAKGVIYHLSGKTDGNKARNWQSKATTFVNGGSIIVTEEELNAWAASLNGAPAAPAKPAAAPAAPPPAGGTPASNDFISASGLNFRLDGDKFHVSQKVLLNYYGIAKEVVMQAEGGFARSGDGFAFKPERVYLGSCPLHLLPGMTPALVRALVAKQKVSDDFRAAWVKISDMAVDGGLLKITTQP
ncbi:MAG: hypothetical protein C0502_03295 [Opitutus sp.]|nr:hypothetical protein [Opitutus sp.]